MTRIDTGLDDKHRAAARNCIAYNAAVLAELSELKSVGATQVVLAARWSVQSELQASLDGWVPALRQTITHIREADLDVVLVAEVPRPLNRVPQCIARRGVEARPCTEVERERGAATAALKSLAREIPGVQVIDLGDEFCGTELCQVVRDGVVIYSDDSHLSVAASVALAGELGRQLVGVQKQSRQD